MKPQQIADKKRKLISDLLTARNKMLAIAYRSIGSGETLQELAKRLNRVELRNQAKAINSMKGIVLRVSKKCKSTLPKEEDDPNIIFPIIWGYFDRHQVPQGLKQKVVYPAAQKFEENEKKAYIEFLEERKFETGENAIFYLASEHDDCAEDHLPYQGKLYCDKHWRSKVANKDKAAIQSFISSHQIKPMQWVISRPAWLITRPNCRHYFQPIPVEEAFTNTIPALIEKYQMHHEVGQRGSLQSIRHPINKGWYTKSNVMSILNQYLERLRLHKELYEAKQTQEMADQIRKDRLLVERWRRYLRVNF